MRFAAALLLTAAGCSFQPASHECSFGPDAGAGSACASAGSTCEIQHSLYAEQCLCLAGQQVWHCCQDCSHGECSGQCPGLRPDGGEPCCPPAPCRYGDRTCVCVDHQWSCAPPDGGHD